MRQLQALEHLTQLAPKVPEVHANLGLAYFFEGRPAEALDPWSVRESSTRNFPELEPMIGLAKPSWANALRPSDSCARIYHPSDDDTGRLSGLHLLRCYSDMKQPDKALIVGETLLSAISMRPEILYQLSRLHAERSSDLMSALLRTAPDSAWMHYANAQVQESLDRMDTAAQEYRQRSKRIRQCSACTIDSGRLILRVSRTPEAVEKAKGEFQQELALARAMPTRNLNSARSDANN